MTPKLIFVNLLIDSLWTDDNLLEKIFDVKSPNVNSLSRINEYLGQYFANDGDYVVCPAKPSHNIEALQAAYLNQSKVNWVYTHSALNQIEFFATEVANGLKNANIKDLIIAGVSPLESAIARNLDLLQGYDELATARMVNRKDYLLTISEDLSIKIPTSEVVTAEAIEPGNYLYKSLVSSGGSGVYGYSDMERIKIWVHRKGLDSRWKKSEWLKQEVLEREQDFNCFGTTDSDRFQTVKIRYDKNRLSYQHDFDFEIESKILDELKSTFNKIRKHLVDKGYKGPFGFDSIVTKSKDIYTIVDLNVRMNKSHVLRQIMQRFKVRKLYTSFYRLRFINSQWPSFESFWKFVIESSNINSNRDSFLFPVDASFWNEGKSECLIALSTDDRLLKDRIDQWVLRFISNHGGQSSD